MTLWQPLAASGSLWCQGKETVKKTDIAAFYKQMFDVGDDDDDTNGGVDQAVDVTVADHVKKAATKRHKKSASSRGKKASTATKEKEAVLPAAPTAEEEIENRVLASALGDNDGYVAAEEMETGTEAALPTPTSSEAIGELAETVT